MGAESRGLGAYFLPKMAKTVEIPVAEVRDWLRVVDALTRDVHSNGHMQKADKIRVLGRAKKLREGMRAHIQLTMF